MGRIRSIKPEFFKHPGLYDLEKESGMPIRVSFAGLWPVCDREGRFRWNPRVLKTDIVPYDEVDFTRVLDLLKKHGYIARYVVDGEVYGYIPSWHTHQVVNPRESQSKIPAPPEFSYGETPYLKLVDSQSLDACPTRRDASTDLDVLARGEGELEVELEGEGNTPLALTPLESAPPLTAPSSLQLITLPLNVKNTEHPITAADIAEWTPLYPGIDVMQELRNMRGWLLSRPNRRKTKSGIRKFVTNWLSRAQNSSTERSGYGSGQQSSASGANRKAGAFHSGERYERTPDMEL